MDLERVNGRASELYSSLKKKADDDTAQMAVGMILFWPALFFLEGGDGPEAAEYAKLKGEREALEKTAIQKQCGLQTAGQGILPPANSKTAAVASTVAATGNAESASVAPVTVAQGTGKAGRNWFNAAQFGKSLDCDPSAPPQLLTETTGAEVYQLNCTGRSTPLVVKCTSEQCSGI